MQEISRGIIWGRISVFAWKDWENVQKSHSW